MTNVKIVIDTCSLINFFKYYYFDLDNGGTTYNKLKAFLLKKIANGEIIVLDKVFDELKSSKFVNFKNEIKAMVINTTSFVPEIPKLSTKYYVKQNEIFYRDKITHNIDQNQINIAVQECENGADLYLIAKCNELKNSGIKPILITDESFSGKDNKLVDKLPKICEQEGIHYESTPKLLFEIYKKELLFSLEVKP